MAKWQVRAREVCGRYRRNVKELRQGGQDTASSGFAVRKKSSIEEPLQKVMEQLGLSAYLSAITREVEAVEWAVRSLEHIAQGESCGQRAREQAQNILNIAELCYTKSGRSVASAADAMYCSRESAYLYHSVFLRLVAAKMGYIKHYKS